MNLTQIDRLLAAVPAEHRGAPRRRVHGYAAIARRCDERIIGAARRPRARAARASTTWPTTAAISRRRPTRRSRWLVELDSLERVQPRIDSWLRVSVGAVSDEVQMGPVGEGPI